MYPGLFLVTYSPLYVPVVLLDHIHVESHIITLNHPFDEGCTHL
jgi:hypothetical protein